MGSSSSLAYHNERSIHKHSCTGFVQDHGSSLPLAEGFQHLHPLCYHASTDVGQYQLQVPEGLAELAHEVQDMGRNYMSSPQTSQALHRLRRLSKDLASSQVMKANMDTGTRGSDDAPGSIYLW